MPEMPAPVSRGGGAFEGIKKFLVYTFFILLLLYLLIGPIFNIGGRLITESKFSVQANDFSVIPFIQTIKGLFNDAKSAVTSITNPTAPAGSSGTPATSPAPGAAPAQSGQQPAANPPNPPAAPSGQPKPVAAGKPAAKAGTGQDSGHWYSSWWGIGLMVIAGIAVVAFSGFKVTKRIQRRKAEEIVARLRSRGADTAGTREASDTGGTGRW